MELTVCFSLSVNDQCSDSVKTSDSDKTDTLMEHNIVNCMCVVIHVLILLCFLKGIHKIIE